MCLFKGSVGYPVLCPVPRLREAPRIRYRAHEGGNPCAAVVVH